MWPLLLACTTIAVVVPPDTAEVTRRVDHELLVRVGAPLAARDPVLAPLLVRALRAADPAAFIHTSDVDVLHEALRLDLHMHDTMSRLRLAELGRQKLARGPDPTHAELEAWRLAHAERFSHPERLTVAEVFLAHPADAADLAALVADDPSPDDAFQRGDPRVDRRPLRTVTALPGGPPATDRWTTPRRSDDGWHTFRLHSHTPAHLPPLHTIHAAVRADWSRTSERAAVAAALDGLRTRVTVRERP